MKNLKPHQLDVLAMLFVRDYCKANQINFEVPEGDAAEPFFICSGETKCQIATGEIPATGNTAAIFKTLEIEFTVFNTDEAGLFVGRVHYTYTHPSGGSNGHNIDLTIVTRPNLRSGGLPFEYVGAVPRHLLHVYGTNIVNLQEDHKKKS